MPPTGLTHRHFHWIRHTSHFCCLFINIQHSQIGRELQNRPQRLFWARIFWFTNNHRIAVAGWKPLSDEKVMSLGHTVIALLQLCLKRTDVSTRAYFTKISYLYPDNFVKASSPPLFRIFFIENCVFSQKFFFFAFF